MAASFFQRRLQSFSILPSHFSSKITSPQWHFVTRSLTSHSSNGFSNVLEFATIQPLGGQLTPATFRSKAAFVINTASQCSSASQLKELQVLHEKYSDKGLVVVAVPSNDFAGREPGTPDDILKRYATLNVSFYITHKTVVTGEKAHPFFKRIAEKYSTSVAPTWNFDKFLVDHRGEMRAVFPNDTGPLMEEVVAEIEEVLEELPRALEPGQELIDEEEYDYEDEESEDEDNEESDHTEAQSRRSK